MSAPLQLAWNSAEEPLHSLDAEQALLGCVLFDNMALMSADGLMPEMFFEPCHARVWANIIDRAKTATVEPIWLWERMSEDAGLKEFGGLRYLADLVDRAPPQTNAGEYAAVIHDLALRRSLADICAKVTRRVMDRGQTAFQHISEVEHAVSELATGAAPADANLIDARSSVERTLAEIEDEAAHGKPRGLKTGIRCFDRRLGGLRPGHLVILGSRPSMGKTGIARQAARGAASMNPRETFAFFCLEMTAREIDERTISELSHEESPTDGIAYQDMSGEELAPDQRYRLKELAWKVPRNLILYDNATLTVEHVRRAVWALKRKGKLGAIFIDYLQIMSRPDAHGRNDAAILGDMTASLKRLAREAEICVVVLSQINRAVEQRDDKRPQLSDLRESGAIEQDANAVLLLFRPFYYLERAEPAETSVEHAKWQTECELVRRRLDVICAKNRGGAVGLDRQEYFAEYDRIIDYFGGPRD